MNEREREREREIEREGEREMENLVSFSFKCTARTRVWHLAICSLNPCYLSIVKPIRLDE